MPEHRWLTGDWCTSPAVYLWLCCFHSTTTYSSNVLINSHFKWTSSRHLHQLQLTGTKLIIKQTHMKTHLWSCFMLCCWWGFMLTEQMELDARSNRTETQTERTHHTTIFGMRIFLMSAQKQVETCAIWKAPKPQLCVAYLPLCWSLSSCCCDWTWQADPRTVKKTPARTEINEAQGRAEISAYLFK